MCSDAELEESVDLAADIMCQYAKDVEVIVKAGSELLSSDLSTWLSLLQTFVDEPFRLSMRAAICSLSVMQGVLNIGKETDFEIDARSMQLLLDATDAVFSYEYFYRPGLQSDMEQSNLVQNVSHVLLAYCGVATDINATTAVVGLPSYESVQSRLRVTAIVLSPGPGAVREVHIPHDSSFLRIPTLEAGPYCLVSYSTAAYEGRVTELLAREPFSVVAGPFRNETENSTAVLREGHFVMDLSVAEEWVGREVVAMFNVTCPGDANSTQPFAVPCLNYSQYDVGCFDHVGAWNFFCPTDMSTNLSCSRILHNVTADYSETCEVEYRGGILNASVACACRKNLKVGYGDRVVVVEFASVLEFVLVDFLETWASIQTVSSTDLQNSAKNLLLLVVVVCILCAAFAYADFVDSRAAKDSLVGKKKSQLPLKRFSQADTEEDTFMSKYCDADTMFPELFRDDTFYQLFVAEIKKSHRWASLCFHYDVEYPRYLKCLFLLSVVNCMLFFNTLLFNWIRVDTGLCGGFHSVSECLEEPSKFAPLKSMCYWDEEMELAGGLNGTSSSFCFYSEPSSSGDVVLTAAAISGLLSIPVIMLLEAIVVFLLCRPVLTPNQVVPATLVNERIHEVAGWGDRSRSGNFCCGKRSTRVGVDVQDDLVYEVCTEMRQLVYDLQQYRKTLKAKETHDFDSRWGFTGSEIEAFLREIERHPCLQPNKCEETDIVVGKKKRVFAPLLSFSEDDPRTPSFQSRGFRRLWNDLLEVRLKVDAEVAAIHTFGMSDDAIGDRMFQTFKQDLLQGIQSQVLAQLFTARLVARTSSAAMAQTFFRHRVSISRGLRSLGFGLLFLLNGFFLLYLLLFSLQQADTGYRQDWLKGFLFWIALEVMVLSTFSMIVTQLVPVLLAFKDLKEVSRLFRAALASVFCDGDVEAPGAGRRSGTGPAGEVVRDAERPLVVRPAVAGEEPFNTSKYFFVSRRLAKLHPSLMESIVIGQFRSVVPNRPYSQQQGPMHGSRVKLRWAACIQSSTAVVVYSFLALISTIPALEYYLFSVVGWLMFGFMSHVGDFHLLGIHIRFSGYFFLVFVVIFYGSLFVVGQKTLKLLQKEYKVGRASLMSKEQIRLKVNKAKLQNASKRIGKLKLKKLKLNSIVPEPTKIEEVVEEEKVDDDDDDKSGVMMEIPPSDEQRDGERVDTAPGDLHKVDDDFVVNPNWNREKEDIENRKNEQLKSLMSLLIADDSSDSDDARELERRRSREQESEHKSDKERMRLLGGGGGVGDGPATVGESEADIASSFLKSMGIFLKKESADSEYVAVAYAVMDLEEGWNNNSNSECHSDSSSEGVTTVAEALDAFRFLTARGISLNDDAEMSQYVDVAGAIKKSEIASARKHEEEMDRDVALYNKFVRYSSDSSDDYD